MFSKGCEYGIRALTVIAEAGKEGRRIGIKEICNIAQTPASFTAKILQNLVRKNILNSQKGPSGGFSISGEIDKILLYDVVVAIDDDSVFTKCGLGLSNCDASRPCPLHEQYQTVRDKLYEVCMQNTLSDLLETYAKDVYNR